MYSNITINDITIFLQVSNPVPVSQWGNEMDKWKIEISVNGTKEKFDYFTGIGHRKTKDVSSSAVLNKEAFLYCIFSDAQLIDTYGEDIDSFADELGYTKASEAMKAFRGCVKIREQLHNLFGEAYETVSEYILENYG